MAVKNPEQSLIMAQGKAASFLWKLHAIKFPDYHPASVWLGRGGLLLGWQESPGAIMLDRAVSVTDKAAALKAEFRPIGRWVDRLSSKRTDRVAQLGEFCAASVLRVDLEQLHNDRGEVCGVEELLPPYEVIEAMFETWIDHNAPRCRRIERFIAQTAVRADD